MENFKSWTFSKNTKVLGWKKWPMKKSLNLLGMKALMLKICWWNQSAGGYKLISIQFLPTQPYQPKVKFFYIKVFCTL